MFTLSAPGKTEVLENFVFNLGSKGKDFDTEGPNILTENPWWTQFRGDKQEHVGSSSFNKM